MDITIGNRIRPRGCVVLPPSKSEAIRAALLLGICGEDPCRAVEGFEPPYCRDIESALLAAGDLRSADAGESAALLRFLIPIQAALFGRVSVRAGARLLSRGLYEAEECLGASLAPLPGAGLIETELTLSAERFDLDCSRSSQFLSGLLMALPLTDHDCEIIIKRGLVSRPYVEMTLDFIRLFGGKIDGTARGFITHPSDYRVPERIPVTGDRSYAAVFDAMNALCGDIMLLGADDRTRQPDKDFYMMSAFEDCDMTDHPDLLPLLAAKACGKAGDTVIRGTARLRTKESDREAGIVELIRSLGGSAEVGPDCVIVHGSGALRGGICGANGDHRMAFAAAVASLVCSEPVTVTGAECVSKSAPGFWRDLEAIGIPCREAE